MTRRERISGLLTPLAGKGLFFCLGWGCGGVLRRADYLQVQLVSLLASPPLLSSEPSIGPDMFALPFPLPSGRPRWGSRWAEGSEDPDLKALLDSRPSVSNSRPFIAGKTLARPAGHATQPHTAQLMSTELITKLGFLASCLP